MKFLFASLFHFILIQTIFEFIHAMYHFYVSSRISRLLCVLLLCIYIATIEACYNMVQNFYFVIALLQTHSHIWFLCIFRKCKYFLSFLGLNELYSDRFRHCHNKGCLWLTMSLLRTISKQVEVIFRK